MPIEYDPSFSTFDPKDCGQPMIDAVQKLADFVERPFDSFVGKTLSEVSDQATEAYGESLPDFWIVWQEWHAPQPKPDMGDL